MMSHRAKGKAMQTIARPIVLGTVVAAAVVIGSACSSSDKFCLAGTHAEGDTCAADIVECGAGSVLQDGRCVLEKYTCATGTHLQDGACVPDSSSCGAGTHLEGSVCVPDTIPPPDVAESADENPASFTLPATGSSIELGGVVNTPADTNQDGFPEADWDTFVFHAAAGTYLRFSAVGIGATRPAFTVMSASADSEGYPYYLRYSMETTASDCERAVYLPFEDDYAVQVTDYENFLVGVFGFSGFPVGGDDFVYRVAVEKLAAPVPTSVTTLPFADAGNWTTGDLRFYNVPAELVEDAVDVRAAGLPVANSGSDVFKILMQFDNSEFIGEANPGYSDVDAQLMLGLSSGKSHLVVMDYLIIAGTRKQYALTMNEVQAHDCMTTTCTAGNLAPSAFALWRFDLAPNDFFNLGVYVASGGPTLDLFLVDEDLLVTFDSGSASSARNGWLKQFALDTQRVYAWVLNNSIGAADYTLDYTFVSTNELLSGTSYTAHTIERMPTGTLPHSGVDRFLGTAGQLAVITGFSPHHPSGGLVHPIESVVTTGMEVIGPAVDTRQASMSTAFLSPLLAPIPETNPYLHLAQDPTAGNAALQATYDLTFSLLSPVSLGSLSAGGSLAATAQTVDATARLKVFALTGTLNQRAQITVTPASTSALSPEVWVLSPGVAMPVYSDWYFYPSANLSTLGRLHAATAAAGTLVRLNHAIMPGTNYIVVRNIGDVSGDSATFDVNVTAQAALTNDTCASPEAIVLVSGTASVSGSLLGAGADLYLDSGNACTGQSTYGPDVFYSIPLAAGAQLTATLAPAEPFDGVLYVLSDCAAPPTCVKGIDTAGLGSETLSYTAGAGGTYVIGVGSHYTSAAADFTLALTVTPP